MAYRNKGKEGVAWVGHLLLQACGFSILVQQVEENQFGALVAEVLAEKALVKKKVSVEEAWVKKKVLVEEALVKKKILVEAVQ